MLDNSGSIDNQYTTPFILLETAHKIVDQFVLHEDATRMGIISFNADARELAPITTNRSLLDQGLEDMPWPRWTTDMGGGLLMAQDALDLNPRVGCGAAPACPQRACAW